MIRLPMPLALGLGLLCLLPTLVWSDSPYPVRNQNPLSWLRGLPETPDAGVLDHNEQRLGLSLDWASDYQIHKSGDEQILVDAELATATLAWSRGLGAGWELGFTLPWRYQSGGELDPVIIDWHDAFGLPQGGRIEAPRDELHIQYRRQGKVLLDETDAGGGVGDLRLQGGRRLGQHSALQLGLVLPTGDSDQLLGNGALALSAALAWGQHLGSWYPYAHVGGQISQRGDVLADQETPEVIFAGAGLAWALRPQWRLQAQLDGHSALYDSELVTLSEALQLSFGGAYLYRKTRLDLAVVEDIRVGSAADVVFKLDWRQGF